MNVRLPFVILAVTMLSACSREESSGPTTQETPPTPDAAAPASPENTPAGPRVGFGPHRATGVTGIAECDAFLKRYEACMAQAPEEVRPGMQTALETWRSSWRTLAATPVTRDTAAQNCRAAADSVRSQLESYGCAP